MAPVQVLDVWKEVDRVYASSMARALVSQDEAALTDALTATMAMWNYRLPVSTTQQAADAAKGDRCR